MTQLTEKTADAISAQLADVTHGDLDATYWSDGTWTVADRCRPSRAREGMTTADVIMLIADPKFGDPCGCDVLAASDALAARHAAWRRANPAQAADMDAAREQYDLALAQMRAEGAPVEDRVDLGDWYRAELNEISRQYAVTDMWDDGPHVRGIWEL